MHPGPACRAWPVWLNALALDDESIARAVALGCRGVSADHETITVETVAAARRAGLVVAAWTGRTRETLARLAALDVFAACVEEAALDHAHEELAALPARTSPDAPAPAGAHPGDTGGPR